MTSNLFARAIVGRLGDDAFSDAAILQAMLRFEAALASAQARLGLIPADAADAIAQSAADMALDADTLARDAAVAGSLAIPFVAALAAQVRSREAAAAAWVHFGATSQDVLDSALVLCARDATRLLADALAAAGQEAARHARAHASAPALARTLLQPAGITTLGVRFAQWADALTGARRRLLASARDALAVSLGGASGNLAAWGGQGPALRATLADALGLRDSGNTWHTLRAPWLAHACEIALAAGTLGKIAHDIALQAMAEIGELREPDAGGGGSTAMPHKRNPVLSMRIIATVQPLPGLTASLLAGVQQQEQERALGNWQAELGQIPELLTRACAAAGAMAELLAGLQVDAPRCRANIEALHGTVFSESLAAALMPVLGRTEAQALVAGLCRQALDEGRHLREVLRSAADARVRALPSAEIDALFDVDRAAAASVRLIDPLLERAARAV